MRILHLSDIHYDIRKNASYSKVFDNLLSTPDVLGQKFDIIFITGDLIDGFGHGRFADNMNEVSEFVLELLDKAEVDMNNLVVLMGNHEVNQDLYTFNTHAKLKETIFKDNWKLNEVINQSFEAYKESRQVINALSPIKEFVEYSSGMYNSENIVFESPLTKVYVYTINNKKIGIATFNNVWFSGALDNGQLLYGNSLMGADQIEKALEHVQGCDLLIGSAHSSLNYLHEVERTRVENKVITNFDIFLSGHTHYNDTLLQSKSDGVKKVECLFSTCPSFNVSNFYSDSKKYTIGFNIIDIKENNDIEINHYSYTDYGKFVHNSEIAAEGKSRFSLEKGKQKDLVEIRDIFYEQKKRFDETLITSIIDTNAPSTVESIFAKPTLIADTKKRKDVDVSNGSEEKKKIDVNELVANYSQIGIFGTKESGKSTILYKIFSDVLKNSLQTNVYPLYVNVNGNRANITFNELIRNEFPLINLKKVYSFFENKEIVLLIDNIRFTEEVLIDSILEFIEKYPVVKVIFSSSLMLSGEIPLEFYKSKLFQYKCVSIKPMTIETIESYSTQWLDVYDRKDEAVKRIVEFSKEKHMPTYPIYLSMLLWLTESKKSFDSFDNALIIENFTEKLLQKHHNAQDLYKEFAYPDKIELLIHIANYFDDNKLYQINETRFDHIISTYLIDNNLDVPFNSKDISNYLLNSGIFTYYCENTICFRYDCVYDYLLAKGLDEDEDRLNCVLTTDKLYDYVEVLDILTTLKSNTASINETVVKKLEENIKHFSTEVGLKLADIDSFYHREFAIMPHVDDDKNFEKEQKKIVVENENEITNNQLIDSEVYQKQILDRRGEALNLLEQFERIIVLSARVFRNSNQFRARDDINIQFDNIVTAAMQFIFMYNMRNIKQLIELDSIENDSRLPYIFMTVIFAPVVTESFLQGNIGTIKLKGIIQNYFDDYINKSSYDISHLKEFIVRFLMLENESISKSQIHKYIRESDEHFIIDNIYMKLVSMYFLEDDDVKSDYYLECIRELKQKNKNWRQKEQVSDEINKLKKIKAKNQFN